MPSLLEADRLELLKLARAAVTEIVTKRRLVPLPSSLSPIFEERRGVFVTLHFAKRLRGCIGVLDSKESLGMAVIHCAASAATEDPRFAAVNADELPGIRIELSVLSELTPIRPADIVIGVHGLAIFSQQRKGVLLPQVAVAHQLDRQQFLAETCKKAGLPPDAWQDPGTQIMGFTSEIFSEPD